MMKHATIRVPGLKVAVPLPADAIPQDLVPSELAFGKIVKVMPRATDRYGRYCGRCGAARWPGAQ